MPPTDTSWEVHTMVAATASDLCTAAPICAISSVASNEPENGTGGGDTALDWEMNTDTLTAKLRAERAGNGAGRVYALTVECKKYHRDKESN